MMKTRKRKQKSITEESKPPQDEAIKYTEFRLEEED